MHKAGHKETGLCLKTLDSNLSSKDTKVAEGFDGPLHNFCVTVYPTLSIYFNSYTVRYAKM
jgi:hypothetical protein